jgi:hypothetical protein
MHKLLDTGSVGLRGHALGAFDMHRVKSLRAMFGVETDRIHHRARVPHRIRHRLSVPDIGPNGLQERIIGPEQRPALIRVPRRNPHDIPARMQAVDNALVEEAVAPKTVMMRRPIRC